jgi:hypothetical protein
MPPPPADAAAAADAAADAAAVTDAATDAAGRCRRRHRRRRRCGRRRQSVASRTNSVTYFWGAVLSTAPRKTVIERG